MSAVVGQDQLSAPLDPRIVHVETLRHALDTSFGLDQDDIGQGGKRILPLAGDFNQDAKILGFNGFSLYIWEGVPTALTGNKEGVESSEVWDQPLDRNRWQFGVRTEYRYYGAASLEQDEI